MVKGRLGFSVYSVLFFVLFFENGLECGFGGWYFVSFFIRMVKREFRM